ncbi:siderophore-interacting protein [Antarcticirhabdus aurantiaca]|uniref:Siderophore-interacting protein n=1 Tax=Antarcticirhabdus aurantiaca TaxID=2606717 RepID=A0ACD4NPX4_9HYPH|nr:siderophore-interacting protein [Antarcticirhabdus aurantiaca]WAJ28751.1 siderophore-interacting protein [Jeongeuplla avenae]
MSAFPLTASAEIRVPGSWQLLERVCEHYAEHGDASFADGIGRIDVPYGSARLIVSGPDAISVTVDGCDPIGLSYMKLGVAEHLAEMAEGPVEPFAWNGDGTDVRLPPFLREMRVVSTTRLTPHMQRVRLAGEDLGRYASDGLHIRLVWPPKGRAPVWPTLGEDGRMVWPQGPDRPEARVYTIRRIDVAAGWVDIDIVLHPGLDTPGSLFAEDARPGDPVGMMGPGGGMEPDAASLVLLGDDTALPAVARIVESLKPGTHAVVFLEVDGPADELPIAVPEGAEAQVVWLHRNGAPAGTAGLLSQAVRGLDWAAMPADTFVWAGCEFADFREIRKFLRKERRLRKDRHLVVSYWRRGLAGDEAHAPAGEE